MQSSQRKVCSAIAFVIAAMGASAAMAQVGPTIIGGGSSLVGPSIQSEISLFPVSQGAFTYFITSSGVGQTAFLGNNPAAFQAGLTGTVDFANSDSALSSAQITAYQAALGATDGPLIQIPYIVTPITIPLVGAPAVPTDSTTPQTTPGQTHSIALNDDDLCGVFSGRITDWAGTGPTHANAIINPDTGAAYTTTATPIKVVYRSDSSGTSELLTRHLAAVCSTSNSAVTFVDSTTFAASFPGGVVPGNFVPATGSGNVRASLVAASGSAVGYLSPDFANTFLAPSSVSASPALAVASLFNSTTKADVAPTAANATTALGTVTPPTGNTATSPAATQTNWVPNSGNPTAGYPVSGTSQIIVSQCYASPAVTSAVLGFLNDHYTSASFQAIVLGNGFNTVPSNFQASIVNDFLSASSRNNPTTLNIGNATVCKTPIAGR